MERYKKKLDKIHAPQNLIDRTLVKIHAQSKMHRPSKPAKFIRVLIPVVVTVSIVLAFGITKISHQKNDIFYNITSNALIKTIDNQQNENINIDEYSEYLGISINNLIKEATLVSAKILVQKTNEVIAWDEATLVYNLNEKPITIKLSKNNNIAVDIPKDIHYSTINNYAVLAFMSKSGNELTAITDYKNVSVIITSFSMTKNEFENFLIDFLDYWKNFKKIETFCCTKKYYYMGLIPKTIII